MIGVIHLPPLPGSPGYKVHRFPPGLGRSWGFEDIVSYAVEEARKYEDAGFDAVLVENYGDRPYASRPGKAETAALAVIAREVSRSTSLLVGVNALRNGGAEAVTAAVAGGAEFIRVNSLCEPRLAPEGFLSPEARRVAEAVYRLQARSLTVLADIGVKHSWAISEVELAGVASECSERGFADAIVVTGRRTGEPPREKDLDDAGSAGLPVLVGSGLTPENAGLLLRKAHGAIVGSSVKITGRPEYPVDPGAARGLVRAVRGMKR